MRIAFDIDGVVTKICPLIAGIARELGYELDPTSFNQYYFRFFGVPSIKETSKIMEDILDILFTQRNDEIQPYDDALLVLPRLVSILNFHQEPVMFLTARKECYRKNTMEWLKKHFHFPFMVFHAGSRKKADFLKAHGYTHFVEDRFRTANQLATAGITPFLINRRWNFGRESVRGVLRVNNFFDIYYFVLLSQE